MDLKNERRHVPVLANSRRRNEGGFTVMELLAAMVILVTLLTCFYATLRGVYRVQKQFEAETMAIVVMNNLVERLDAEETVEAAEVSRIFKDECAKSPISRIKEFTPEYKVDGGVITVRILKRNGKNLAGLEFKQ